MDIKVSIIVPIYNMEKYLKKCIDSIIEQDYTKYELILVDDGSKDNSKKICEEYLDNNRVLYKYKKNGGLSSARNFGIENSKGKYILIVDADDYLEKGIIKKLVHNAEKYNADISFAALTIVDENTQEKIWNTNTLTEEVVVYDNIQYMCNILDEKTMDATMHTKLIKKDIIKDSRFNVNTKLGEDLEFFYNIYRNLNRIVYQNIRGEYILQRNNSLSRSKYDSRDFNEVMMCKNNFNKITDEKLKQYSLKRLLRATVTSIQKMISSDNIKEYKNDIIELKKILRENQNWYIKSKFFTKKQKITYMLCLYCTSAYKIYLNMKGINK